MNNNKKALFNEAKQFTKNKVQKGPAEDPGSGQAGSTSRTRTTDRTTGKGHRTIDDNPTPDKGNTGVRHQTLTRQEWLRAGAGN